LLDTGWVVTVNVAVVAPAATVTLAGTVAAAVLLLVRLTTAPPAGAGPFSVIVPAEELPPVTVVGLKVTELGTGVFTVRVALFVAVLYVAEMDAIVVLLTAMLVTVNVAVVAPAATVTLAGTVATAVLVLSATITPPAGAAAFRVTVPVDDVPPVTDLGLKLNELGTGPRTVSVPLAVPPL